jgi:hypothetical protein
VDTKCCLFALPLLIVLSSLQSFSAQDASPRKPLPWDTCIYVEGKGDFCRMGEKPRKFEEYLRPDWLKEPVDGFSVNTGLDRLQPGKDILTAKWQDVGILGSGRIRQVEYFVNGQPMAASLILAERKDGLFVPLMKWNGELPEIQVYRPGESGIIGFSRDFGGNIPMVKTWAWTSSTGGPQRMDLQQALNDAIQKVSSIHGCYNMAFEWDTLHLDTWCWPGEWKGKPNATDRMNAWFDLIGEKLVPIRVELRNVDEPDKIKIWP